MSRFNQNFHLVPRIALPGEYIKLIRKYYSFDNLSSFYKVDNILNGYVAILEKDHPDAQMKRKLDDEYVKEWYYEHHFYLVAEGYNPNE